MRAVYYLSGNNGLERWDIDDIISRNVEVLRGRFTYIRGAAEGMVLRGNVEKTNSKYQKKQQQLDNIIIANKEFELVSDFTS